MIILAYSQPGNSPEATKELASQMEFKGRAWPRVNEPLNDVERGLATILSDMYFEQENRSSTIPVASMDELRKQILTREMARIGKGGKPFGIISMYFDKKYNKRRPFIVTDYLVQTLKGLVNKGVLKMTGQQETEGNTPTTNPQNFFRIIPGAVVDPWSVLKNLNLPADVLKSAADASRGKTGPDASMRVKAIFNKESDPTVPAI